MISQIVAKNEMSPYRSNLPFILLGACGLMRLLSALGPSGIRAFMGILSVILLIIAVMALGAMFMAEHIRNQAPQRDTTFLNMDPEDAIPGYNTRLPADYDEDEEPWEFFSESEAEDAEDSEAENAEDSEEENAEDSEEEVDSVEGDVSEGEGVAYEVDDETDEDDYEEGPEGPIDYTNK
jgi:hypothetical protein